MTPKFEGSTAQEEQEGSAVEKIEPQEAKAEKEPVEAAYESLAAKGRKLAKAEESLAFLREKGHTETAKKIIRDIEAELETLKSDFESARAAFSTEFEPMRTEIAAEGEEIMAAREEAPESFEASQAKLQTKNAESIKAEFGEEAGSDAHSYNKDGQRTDLESFESSQANLQTKNAEEMKKYFGSDESTMVKNYDAQGNEIVDAEPALETFEESQAKLKAKNAEAIKAEFGEEVGSAVHSYDKEGNRTDLESAPAETPKAETGEPAAVAAEAKPGRVIDEGVQAESLDDFRRGLKGEPAAVQAEAGAVEAKAGRVIDEGVQMEALDDFRRSLKGEKKEGQEKPSKWGKAWGWIKRRAKGLATLGITSYHQGEKYRSGTGEVAKDLSEKGYGEMQKNIKRVGAGISAEGVDKRLTLDEALEEAERMQEMTKAEGKQETTKADLENYSKAVTAEKIAENDAFVGKLVAGAETKLKDKLAKYRDELDRPVLSEEKLAQFRTKMTEQMRDLRKGIETQHGVLESIGSNPEQIKKIVRESFDPKYWKHYVYGGLETAVGLIAAKIVLSKMLVENAVAAVPNVVPTPSGFEMPSNLNMHKSVWDTAQGYLQNQMGIDNPSKGQILKLMNGLDADNGIGVLEHGTTGSIMDVSMPEGFGLKVGTAARAAITAIRMAM